MDTRDVDGGCIFIYMQARVVAAVACGPLAGRHVALCTHGATVALKLAARTGAGWDITGA